MATYGPFPWIRPTLLDGTIQVSLRITRDNPQFPGLYLWEYTVHNVSYNPGGVGLNVLVVAAVNVPEKTNFFSPGNTWTVNSVSFNSPASRVAWIQNPLGTGILPGETGTFGFTTLPRKPQQVAAVPDPGIANSGFYIDPIVRILSAKITGDLMVPGPLGEFSCPATVSLETTNSAGVTVDSTSGVGTGMNAAFTAYAGLSATAAACGFSGFDWQQTIINLPDPSPFYARNNGAPIHLTSASGQFNDPPPGGGYTYTLAPDNSYPFYYDTVNGELLVHETATTLSFRDAPADVCLEDPILHIPSIDYLANINDAQAQCGHSTAPSGSFIAFTTALVGVVHSDVLGLLQSDVVGPRLFQWSWTDTFNGTAGGIATTKNSLTVDSGSGTGGITITSINGVPLTVIPSTQIATTASGLAYSRVSQTFNGTVTIANLSGSAISGPFQMVFTSLTPGVTLANSAGMFNGSPFITVTGTSLTPGQSATVNLQFRNPSNAKINFTPVIYSGSFN